MLEVGILLGMGIVFFGIATWSFKFDEHTFRHLAEATCANG
jgi:hypothetical protein